MEWLTFFFIPSLCIICMAQGNKKCGPPLTINNGDTITLSKEEYSPGSFVEYRCQMFYLLEGRKKSFCENGTWTDTPRCLDPCFISLEEMAEQRLIPKGRSNESMYLAIGDSFEIQCISGFELQSKLDFKVECKRNQTVYPKCIADKECRAPPSVENGDIITPEMSKYATGSVVEYRCQDHHRLEGSRTITCQHGMWTKPPTCRDVGCGVPPELENANIIGSKKHSYLSGETVHYQCHAGFQNRDSNNITCSGGKWTGSPSCGGDLGSGEFNNYDNAV
ncbi:coagulation factor XIII B chain-like [Petaurus breviceps papuanus]|uniref:coagulation factor XIII B chain-like n=1 Tax=Petaurus breviceps papuanus TaxID=3040969 RepID=UPI0036D807DD